MQKDQIVFRRQQKSDEKALLKLGKYMEFQRSVIVSCKALPKYRVWIRFDDGLEGEVDLSNLVGKGVFKDWESVNFFNQVRIDPKTDTLTWGNDIDLDPYVLRDKIS